MGESNSPAPTHLDEFEKRKENTPDTPIWIEPCDLQTLLNNAAHDTDNIARIAQLFYSPIRAVQKSRIGMEAQDQLIYNLIECSCQDSPDFFPLLQVAIQFFRAGTEEVPESAFNALQATLIKSGHIGFKQPTPKETSIYFSGSSSLDQLINTEFKSILDNPEFNGEQIGHVELANELRKKKPFNELNMNYTLFLAREELKNNSSRWLNKFARYCRVANLSEREINALMAAQSICNEPFFDDAEFWKAYSDNANTVFSEKERMVALIHYKKIPLKLHCIIKEYEKLLEILIKLLPNQSRISVALISEMTAAIEKSWGVNKESANQSENIRTKAANKAIALLSSYYVKKERNSHELSGPRTQHGV